MYNKLRSYMATWQDLNPIHLTLAISGGISILVVAFALAYYLVIYLPKKDVQTLELQNKQKQEQTDLENKQKQEQQSIKKANYDLCMIKAVNAYNENWISRCKVNNVPITKNENGDDSCVMSDYLSQSVTDQYTANKDTCLKIYQSN